MGWCGDLFFVYKFKYSMYDEVKLKENVMAGQRFSSVAIYFSLAVLVLPLFIGINQANAVSTPTYKRPSGMIVRDSNNNYYYTYYTPGAGFGTPKLRYIGQADVLDYYLQRGRQVYTISNTEKATYTMHNHGLTLPCGEAVRDDDGRIAFMEPLSTQDQADGNVASSENFAYYVPFVNWDYPGYIDDAHHQNILKGSGYNQVSAISSLLEETIFPFGVPNCTIVKQQGTSDYYRVFRHQQDYSTSVQRKMKIGSAEILDLWLNYNTHTYEADITALPNVGGASLPPGLLVRTEDSPIVYFVDDQSKKVRINTIEEFNALGFGANDVTYVSQAVLDTAPYSQFSN